MTTLRSARIFVTLLLATCCVIGAGAQAPPAKNPLLKLAEPWPDAEQLRQRKTAAELLRLFADERPIAFTLAGDFKAINKDRNPNSRKRFPAHLTMTREDGRTDVIEVQLGARGHVRRMKQTCDFVPLRLEFAKDAVKETLFEGQDALKLVVQCRNAGDFEEYLLREYLAYRILNVLTPHGLRARLTRVTYLDAAGKSAGTRYGMLLEDDGDVAKRMLGRTVELPRVQFKDLDATSLATMMIFEYMIGSTDFSIYALHNVVLVQTPDRMLYPVPYDFDMAGLVSPPYAIPDRQFPIKSVKERLYRGPCRTLEQVETILARFAATQGAVMALPDAIPDLGKISRAETKSFLDGFYRSVKDQKEVKRVFVESCSKAPAM
jgi:hypothetical protein